RRQRQIVDTVDSVRGEVRWIGFEAKEKFGARQNELQSRFNAALELRVICASTLVEVHQRVKRGVVQRLAISHAPQRGENLLRTRRLLARRMRRANEDLAAGSRIAGTHLPVRTVDSYTIDRRIACNIETVYSRAEEWLDEIVTLRVTSQDRGRGDRVSAGLDRYANGETPIQVCPKRAGICGYRSEVFFAAGVHQLQARTVHRDFDIMRIFHAAHQVKRVPPEPDLDGVLAIERKGVLNQNAAACTQWQAVDVLILRKVGPHAVSDRARRDVGIAHSRAADVPRR